MIHLDTSFLIGAMQTNSAMATQLDGWVLAGEEVNVSSIALAEFFCGGAGRPVLPLVALQLSAQFPTPESFTAADAWEAARIFNFVGRPRRMFNDCMIAAVAIRKGGKLAAANVSDFIRMVPLGLILI